MRKIPLLALLFLSTCAFGRQAVVFGPEGALVVTKKLCFQDNTCQESANVAGGVGSVTATPPIVSSGGSSPVISCITATGSVAGCLSAADWTTFNSKQSALSFGDLTDAGTDGITVTGGTGAVIGAGTSLSQHVADASHNGYLSSGDWSTFNGKQAAGSYITALTGEGSASGPGSAAFTLGSTIAGATTFSTSLTSPIFKSSTANPASAGQVRLASSDTLAFRSTANTFDNTLSVINNTVLPSMPAGTNIFKFNSMPGFDAAIVQAGDPAVRGVFYGSDMRATFQYLATDQTTLDNINLHSDTKEYAHLAISDSTGQTPNGGFGHLHVEDVTDGGRITLAKARGASTAALSVVQSGDVLGNITAAGYDGTDFEPGAKILFGVDGTPGSNDMPGSITFQTTPDGSLTPVTAMKIDQRGSVKTGTGTANLDGTLADFSSANDSTVGAGNITALLAAQYSTSSTPRFMVFKKARGTFASPSAVVNNDGIMTINGSIYDGSTYSFAAGIQFMVDGTPSAGTSAPGKILFNVTPSGSTTPAAALTIASTKIATFAGNIVAGAAGATSNSALSTSGSPATGGSSTTTKPLVRFGTAATDNNWNTSGTVLGINPGSGFTGNLFDVQKNAVRAFVIDASGNMTVTGTSTLTSTVSLGQHLGSQSTAVTATVHANAGTGATCTVSNATDVAGFVTLTTTNTASASGEQCRVNFAVSYGVAPVCTFSPVGPNPALFSVVQGIYMSSGLSNLFINFANADATGRPYTFAYHCVETQ